MSDRSIQVKAILLKEGVEDRMKEIRRFRVDEDGSGTGGRQRLQSLVNRVHSVFNIDTTTQRCNLFWKDEEDDLIQFSTEDELTHALENRSDDTLRVYVVVSEADEEHETNRHVTFDLSPLYTDPASVAMVTCPGMRCGHKGKKGRKAAWKRNKMMEAPQNEEFQKVRQQVPAKFRSWVRQYVGTWYDQGPEAAMAGATEKLPEGIGHNFPEWLNTFLSHHRSHPHPTTTPLSSEEGKGEIDMEVEMRDVPEGLLPPVYFRWLCLFLPRFFWRRDHVRAATSVDCEGGERGHYHREGHKRGCHKGQGKHGCHGKKGDKHGAEGTSSESEDSDGGQKPWKKVPKEFRKYARITLKQLHKGNGDNSDNKEQATRAGLSAEVQEFVEQILMEWHAKLSFQGPRAVAMEMMEGERTLPSGLEQEHFLWLCRFLARWHRRHAGKCDVMSGWSSGETTTDDTSGDETTPFGVQGYAPWSRGGRRHFRAVMKMMKGGHPHGMMGYPHPHFAMHPGMGYPCYPPYPYGLKHGAKRCCCKMGSTQQGGCRRWKNQDGAGQGEASAAHDDAVKHVTEGVKRM